MSRMMREAGMAYPSVARVVLVAAAAELEAADGRYVCTYIHTVISEPEMGRRGRARNTEAGTSVAPTP